MRIYKRTKIINSLLRRQPIMKKAHKLLSLIAATILTLGVMLICACGGGEPATAYTVYVKDESGNAISNVMVGICVYDETTGEKSTCLNPKLSDEDGKVVFEENEGTYIINEDTLGNYKCKEKCLLKAYGDYTIVLIAK